MKKLLVVLFASLSIGTFALDGYLRVGGVTNASTFDIEDNYKSYAPSFGFEVSQSFLLADLGLGVTYNKGNSDINIDTVPVYALARLNPFPVLNPYLVAKVGYVPYTQGNKYDLDGSGYYGIGVGVNFSSLQAEILYSETKLQNKDLEQVSLNFGFKLF